MDKDIKEYIPQEQTYIERIATVREAIYAASGITLTLTDTSENATYLKSSYYNYYWYRK